MENLYLQKIWINNKYTKYKLSSLPGLKKGVSGSTVGGYNIGISKYSKECKRNATLQVLSYITSKESHKKYVLKGYIFSSIPSIYDDEEVCSSVDCEFYISFQPISRPVNIINEKIIYDNYSSKFRNTIYKYLYGNNSIDEVLQELVDILKFYNVSINSSYVGKITIIILTVVFIFIMSSSMIINFKKYKQYFTLLSYDFWIIFFIGILILFVLCGIEFGEVQIIKCKMKPILLFIGNMFCLFPFIYELLIYFPEEIEISVWLDKHRFITFLIYFFINVIVTISLLLVPLRVEELFIDNGKNFKYCKIDNTMGLTLNTTLYALYIINLLVIIFIIFLEWNIQETFIEIKLIAFTTYTIVLVFIILAVLNFVLIKNYIYNFIIYEVLYFILIIINYSILFFSKIIMTFTNKRKSFPFKYTMESMSSIDKIPSNIEYAGSNSYEISEYITKYRNKKSLEILNEKLKNYDTSNYSFC